MNADVHRDALGIIADGVDDAAEAVGDLLRKIEDGGQP